MHAEGLRDEDSDAADAALQRGRVQMHAEGSPALRWRIVGLRFNGAACRCTRKEAKLQSVVARRCGFNGAACRCTRKGSPRPKPGEAAHPLQRGRVQMHAEGLMLIGTASQVRALQRGRVQMHAEGIRSDRRRDVLAPASTGPRADARGRVGGLPFGVALAELQRGRVQMHAEGVCAERQRARRCRLQRGRVQMHAEGLPRGRWRGRAARASTGPRADARGRHRPSSLCGDEKACFNGAACRCTRKGT